MKETDAQIMKVLSYFFFHFSLMVCYAVVLIS